jgi:hypothetical protein
LGRKNVLLKINGEEKNVKKLVSEVLMWVGYGGRKM